MWSLTLCSPIIVPFQILKNNVVQHDATAREWTAKYAM